MQIDTILLGEINQFKKPTNISFPRSVVTNTEFYKCKLYEQD